MATKPIKFGNKDAKQIISNNLKNTISEKIKNITGKDITSRDYNFLNEKNMHLLKNEDYKICLNTFGQKYILLLTKINKKRETIFINRKRGDMVMVNLNFSDNLYGDTIIDGELIKNNEDKWTYVITDIVALKGKNIKQEINLENRLEILKNIFKNQYFHDTDKEMCKIDIKEYFSYAYLEDLCSNYIKSVPYKCSGIFFQHENCDDRAFMYIFPENRTNDKLKNIATGSGTGSGIESKVEEKNVEETVIPIDPKKHKFFNFLVKKNHSLPDIYELYHTQNNNTIKYGYASVPNFEVSKKLASIFEDVDEDDKIEMKCHYLEKFDKWIPQEISKE